jgi:hypothetical protein
MDVLDLSGSQSLGGHHAILYATTDIEPVGTTREWLNPDQLKTRFVGSIGGEGGSVTKPPAGAVFRVHAGQALVMQTHYLNATDKALVGTSRLDVKMVDADPNAKVVSMFSSTNIILNIPPGKPTTVDARCELQENVPLILYANHMHAMGTSIFTRLTVDGATDDVKSDPVWNPAWAFEPEYGRRELGSPLMLPAGSTLTTTCTWMNSGATALGFPDEMCVFFTLYVGEQDITCAGGLWLKS